MTQAGPAIPVIVSTQPPDGGPALRVVVVSDGRPTEGGPARSVIVVTDGRPTQGNEPIPVVVASGAQSSSVMAGPAMPVVVVSGSLGGSPPVNTVLPVISGGDAAVVTTDTGTWTGDAPIVYTYQWKRNGVAIGGATASSYTIITADIGTAITVTVTATNAAGSASATSAIYTPTYTQKVIALSPIAYWPQAESSGSVALDASGNGRNGAYTAVTLGVPGIGDGRTAASFNGTTSFNNIFTAGLQGAFNGQLGTMAAWVRVSGAGVWTDGTTRVLCNLQVDGSNQITFRRTTTNNLIEGFYRAGGTFKNVQKTSFSPLGWFHLALTWDKAADAAIFYVNGTKEGSTLTGLGTFAGLLATTTTMIGALNTTPSQVWSGNIAHVAVWSSVLSAAQVGTLAVV